MTLKFGDNIPFPTLPWLTSPWERPIYDDLGLHIHLLHLLGNKIALCIKKTSKLEVSAWKLNK